MEVPVTATHSGSSELRDPIELEKGSVDVSSALALFFVCLLADGPSFTHHRSYILSCVLAFHVSFSVPCDCKNGRVWG